MAKFDLVVAAKTVGAGSIKRLGNSMQGVQGKVKNLRLAMAGLNKTFGALGILISGGAFVGLVKGAIDSADSFGKLSDQTGIAANTLQALGISVRGTDGELKTSEQVLGEISDKFADLPDGATKAAISMEIFGRSGASLINLLNGGSAALTEFNFAVSDEFAQNAEFFNDQIATLGIKFDGFRKQLTDALLPTLNNLIGVFSDLFSSDKDFTRLFKIIEGGLKIISAAVFTTIAGFRFLSRTVVDIFKIINEARKLNFSGAKEIGSKGLSDTRNQFQNDLNTFNEIFTGTENAPAEYFKDGAKNANDFAKSVTNAVGTQMQNKLRAFNESLKTVQESMADVVVKGIKGMEDALVNFVMTGKLNFRNLANSIIKDMARIAIQESITKPFTNFITGLFKNADGNAFVNGQVQKYAYGGTVVRKPTLFPMKNGIGLMGEAGAEAILPLRRGANGKLGVQSSGGGSTVINVSVDASGSNVQGNTQQANAFGTALATAIQTELIKQKRPGGLLV